MSSFMVSNETLRKIAAVLDDIETGKNAYLYDRMNTYPTKKELEHLDEYGYADSFDNYQNLYFQLYLMNYEALVARYGESGSEMAPDFDKDTIPKKPELVGGVIAFEPLPMDNPAALKKSIDCYLCQCSESEAIETSPLFKACENLRNALANMIVNQLPAYAAADWA